MGKSSKWIKGENSPNAKLNWPIVGEIRETYEKGGVSYATLGKKYGVSYGNIGKIIRNEIWVINKKDEGDSDGRRTGTVRGRDRKVEKRSKGRNCTMKNY